MHKRCGRKLSLHSQLHAREGSVDLLEGLGGEVIIRHDGVSGIPARNHRLFTNLVFRREVRAQIEMVLGYSNDLPVSSREDFVERQEPLYHEVYSMVRAHLGEQALWRKQSYGMQVRLTTFPLGTWVWLYDVGRSPKWQRNNSGPLLVA